MRFTLAILFFVCCALTRSAVARPSFTYSANCKKAYQQMLAMHFDEARRWIAAEQKEDPQNLLPTYISDYEDCIVLLINADPAEYEKRVAHFDQRLDAISKGDHDSPWYRLCKAGIYLHWALVNVRLSEQYKAALNFRRSIALLKENRERFPSWEYNSVFAGLQQAVMGSLPPSFKWLAAVLGMSGSIRNGAGMLEHFISTHTAESPLYDEASLYYLYVRFYLLNEQKQAWEFLNNGQFKTADNPLNAYVKANIALDYCNADEAIRTLSSVENDAYVHYPIFSYRMGAALLMRCDTQCTTYFNQYLSRTKSGLNIKDCWQKMGYAWYINNNTRRANFCMDQIKVQGSTRIDADRQAERFAERNIWPNRSLLRARMLIDGGYHDHALTVLNGIGINELTNPADQSEYYFRMGRVYEAMGLSGSGQHYKTALSNYRRTIELGKDRHEQFAARAALQMGKIYEALGLYPEAVTSYKECLDMPSHDFQNSIDQQAKAGINRVEKK